MEEENNTSNADNQANPVNSTGNTSVSGRELPNSTAVLVLGICSIVIGCVGVGLVLGIIGVVMAKTGRKLYKENPDAYDDYGKLNAGFIMSIIGIVLGALALLYIVIWVLFIATAATTAMHAAPAFQ